MSGFSQACFAFARRVPQRFDLFLRNVLLRMGKQLVFSSPVGNPTLWESPPPKGYVGGRFRANWQMGHDAMPDGVIDAIDPSGAATVGRLQASALMAKAGGVTYIVNNLPYARRLEFGHSTQCPVGGMVGAVESQFSSFVRGAVSEVIR